MIHESIFSTEIILPLINSINSFSEKNAFCIEEKFYSYNDFAKAISKIRKKIQTTNSGDFFGLVVNDDLETYASIFALWLESKAYIPLHPKQPLLRNLEIIEQVSIDYILDSSVTSCYSKYSVINTSKLVFEKFLLTFENKISDDKLAYILFTSGSTGKPKGVKISRKNIGFFMHAFWKTGIEINEDDRCLQCFDLTFDVSVQSYLVPLVKGACVYTIPHNIVKYSYVYKLLEDHKLTFGAMAASMIKYLQPHFDEIRIESLKYCILTAEASYLDLVEQWQNCVPNALIYDFYGPTEATIYCTYYKFIKGITNKSLNGKLSIGKGLFGFKTVILSDSGEIILNTSKGELCVAGNQITSGYWNNPEKDAEVFIEREIGGVIYRFYKTGDLCCYDEEGDILLYGRKDNQVKIQGFRIEIDEIEFFAKTFLKSINSVCISYTNKLGQTSLALIIENNEFDTEKLIKYLETKLPDYMVPSKICFVPKFPINSSDKIDREKLRILIN